MFDYRATEPPEFPLQHPSTDAGTRAAKLHADWSAKYERIEKVEAERAEAHRALINAEADLRQALYDDAVAGRKPSQATAKAEAAHDQAKAKAEEPWDERVLAASQASDALRTPYEGFVSDNLDELLSELDDAAEQARDRVLDAAREALAAREEWQDVHHAVAALIRPAEAINGRAVPLMGEQAGAMCSAASRLLAAEGTQPVAGSDALPAPTVSKKDLNYRAVALGHAEVVESEGEVDGHVVQGRQIVRS